jgi:hypothetical protein
MWANLAAANGHRLAIPDAGSGKFIELGVSTDGTPGKILEQIVSPLPRDVLHDETSGLTA